jgi:hypothetical protein
MRRLIKFRNVILTRISAARRAGTRLTTLKK